MLEQMLVSIKNAAARGKMAASSLALASLLASPLPAQEQQKIIGSIYGEAGKLWKTFDDQPLLLNVNAGYNITHKDGRDKMLMLPYVRIMPRGDNPEKFWGNYMDLGVGAAYQHAPFIVGVEGVHRERFDSQGVKGNFLRVWSGYWNRWEGKPSKSKHVPMKPWAVGYGEAEWNTLQERPGKHGNAITDLKMIGFTDILNVKNTIIAPYVDAKINFDARNRPWNRYGQIEAGISGRKGPVQMFIGYGHRDHFNQGGVEGQYIIFKTGVWWPIGVR